MASPGNQHCANCIGTLSFSIHSRYLEHTYDTDTHTHTHARTHTHTHTHGADYSVWTTEVVCMTAVVCSGLI